MRLHALSDREDVRAIVRINAAAWRAAYDEIVPETVLEAMGDPDEDGIDRRYRRLRDADGRIVIARRDDEAVGYAFVRWAETKEFVGPDEAGLKELYVHPDCWNEGVGTALLQRAIDRTPDDREALVLETLADNEVGRSFYESRGFRERGKTTVEIGDGTYDAVIYARAL